MGWKDWDRTNRIGVIVGAVLVAVVLVLLVAVVTGGFPQRTSPTPEPTVSASTEQPSSTPTPTYQCTTATGPDCTEDLAEREAARQKILDEAEAAYVTYENALHQALRSGGGDALPANLQEVTGPEMQEELLPLIRAMKSGNWYRTGQIRLDPQIADDSPEWPTKTVRIAACLDASTTTILEKGSNEFVSLGNITTSVVTVQQVDGAWKVVREEDVEEANSCPSS